jgi:hypothetical protein
VANVITPTINAVTGNDVVNLAEKTAGVTVTGTADSGATVTLTWGTVTKKVTAMAAQPSLRCRVTWRALRVPQPLGLCL